MPTKVLIVDDHPVFRAGLKNLLEAQENLKVVGEAKDGLEAIETAEKTKPNVIVMDVSMPKLNGIEATKKILSSGPDTKVIALSIHSGKRYVKDMLSAGASGYLLKDSAPDELVLAIQKVAKGDMYLDSSITSIAMSTDENPLEAGNTSILTTKLHRPPVLEDYILRSNIINLLESNLYKPFSLVAAPAGYGKSVTVSQWLNQSRALHTWVSLDDEHNDFRTFLHYVKAAVEKVFPGSLEKTGALLSSGTLPPFKVIAYALINELDNIEQDFILVLDDYHRINNELIHQMIDEVLRFPPEHMHLVISTRKDPPIKISSLFTHNRMTEIRMGDLLFNDTEIQHLFRKLLNIELNDNSASLLQEKTEGWIVGLRMAMLNVKSQDDVDAAIGNIRGDAWSLSNFLVEEVLLKQPALIQERLLISSILNRFCAELIDAIVPVDKEKSNDGSNGADFIDWLVKSNLFVISLDNERKWFRFHHLIQELFQSKLKKQMPEPKLSKHHILAGRWFEHHGFVEEGLRHMIEGNRAVEACKVVEQRRWAELNKDRWYVVQHWIEKLPIENRQQNPVLLLTECWSLYETFQLEKIPVLLEQAEALIDDSSYGEELRGEQYFFYGAIFYWSGDGHKSLEYFEKAQKRLNPKRKLIAGLLQLLTGLSYCIIGKGDYGIKLLTDQTKDIDGGIFLSRLLGGLFFSNYFMGDLPNARKATRTALEVAIKGGIEYSGAWNYFMEACTDLQSYQLESASQLFSEAVSRRYISHSRGAIDGIAGLALAQHFLGQHKEALESLDLIVKFANELEHPMFMDVARSCRARHALLNGDMQKAIDWERTVNESPSMASMFIWLEIPLITQIRVLIAEGSEHSLTKSAGLLLETLAICEACHFVHHIIELKVLQAVLLEKQQNHAEALEAMKVALKLGEPGGWIRPFVEVGPIVTEMLKELQHQKLAVNFINQVIQAIERYGNLKVNVPAENVQFKKQGLIPKENVESISPRELETVIQLALGLRNKEIADRLYVSEGTVKKHIYNLCQKLGVNNRMTLVKKAKELGFISEL